MDLVFKRGSEVVVIRVQNKVITFSKMVGHFLRFSGIEGLKLDIRGIVREFPDLEGKDNATIKAEGIKRFKAHIEGLDNQEAIKNYIRDDLKKHGYVLTQIYLAGHRPKKV